MVSFLTAWVYAEVVICLLWWSVVEFSQTQVSKDPDIFLNFNACECAWVDLLEQKSQVNWRGSVLAEANKKQPVPSQSLDKPNSILQTQNGVSKDRRTTHRWIQFNFWGAWKWIFIYFQAIHFLCPFLPSLSTSTLSCDIHTSSLLRRLCLFLFPI